MSNKNLKENFIWVFLLIIFIKLWFVDIMEIDAAQYAGIAHQMSDTNSFLLVYEGDHDYLDKPPFLFWITALSFKLFGISNFAYKFPAFVFLILAIISTYKYAVLYYSKEVAKYAILILSSSVAFFNMVNDVRTDGILMGCIITALYGLSAYLKNNKVKHFLMSAFFTGIAMLTKGPIGLLAVVVPVVLNLFILKKWKAIFNLKWLLWISVIVIILLPMCWGLYHQFDLHPEKEVYGLKGPSGLRFFFWTQSFGRITGENYWNNHTSFYYFIHSMIWDFFPWILLFYPALINWFKSRKTIINKDYTTILFLVFSFLMISSSNYKLPHYLYFCMPVLSVIVAKYANLIGDDSMKIYNGIANVLSVVIVFAVVLYTVMYFKTIRYELLWVVVFQLIIYIFIKRSALNFVAGFCLRLTSLYVFLAFVFYPNLLTYQASSNAGKLAKRIIKNNEIIKQFENNDVLFKFYSQRLDANYIDTSNINRYHSDYWVYTTIEGKEKLETIYGKPFRQFEFEDFHITRLKLDFLEFGTRQKLLSKKYLLKFAVRK